MLELRNAFPCCPDKNHVLLGLGLSNLMFGRIVRFSRDTTAFITPVRAAAPSLWPRFGLLCLLLVTYTFDEKFYTYGSEVDAVFSEAPSYCSSFDGISNFCSGA
jgi:hypothetical protein